MVEYLLIGMDIHMLRKQIIRLGEPVNCTFSHFHIIFSSNILIYVKWQQDVFSINKQG